MDKKHNIRNMSVIAHVDHVSTRVREPAPFPGRHPSPGPRAIGVGFGRFLFSRSADGTGIGRGRARRSARPSFAMKPRPGTSSIPSIVRAPACTPDPRRGAASSREAPIGAIPPHAPLYPRFHARNIFHSPTQTTADPPPIPPSFRSTGQVHPDRLPRRGRGYHRPGERWRGSPHRHPPG